jgi:mRNA-degrading endonuclease RelE of RelBE toxin-antitoxin system
MKYRIILAPVAAEDLKMIRAYEASWIKDQIREHLSHQPAHASKSLVKKLST